MAITLTVNNIPFEYPQNGEQPSWGESASSWATEVTNVLNSLKGASDILETAAIIANNVLVPVDVPDFKFNPTTVRSFAVRGNIYRTASALEVAEEFVLIGLRTSTGWQLQQDGIGNAGVTFTITTAGQVQYTSQDLPGSPYQGLLKFRGIGILNS